MRQFRSSTKYLVFVLAGVLLTACAENGPRDTDSAVTATAAAGPDMAPIAAGTALPGGYKVDVLRTIIFGTDERWTGRLAYTTAGDANAVFDFLLKEMPSFGWVEITAMRSNPSLLTFSMAQEPGAASRFATISIIRGPALGSTRVEMVVTLLTPSS